MKNIKKHIHFYKDNESIPSDAYMELLISHNETLDFIKSGLSYIHTVAISALDFAFLLENNYRIYLHENKKSIELKEGATKLTEMEIKKEHNIAKLWIGGCFENYFYS